MAGLGAGGGISKAFVMERGKVGRVLSQLVLDLRHIMEPYTASKLKVLLNYNIYSTILDTSRTLPTHDMHVIGSSEECFEGFCGCSRASRGHSFHHSIKN